MFTIPKSMAVPRGAKYGQLVRRNRTSVVYSLASVSRFYRTTRHPRSTSTTSGSSRPSRRSASADLSRPAGTATTVLGTVQAYDTGCNHISASNLLTVLTRDGPKRCSVSQVDVRLKLVRLGKLVYARRNGVAVASTDTA